MKYKKHNAWVLERYLLNELPGDKIKEINRQLKEDPGLKEEIEKLKHSNKAILDQYPPASIIPPVLNRYNVEKNKNVRVRMPRTRPVFSRRLLYASPAFVLVLVLFFFLLPLYKGNINPAGKSSTPGDTRVKGTQTIDMTKPDLMIYRKENNSVKLLKNGVTAREGDLLQIAYVPGNETYGVIFSIDGNGVVTLHYPGKKNEVTQLKKEKKILLDNAYELDDAPAFERFFFITSKSTIDVESMLRKAKALAQNKRARTGNIQLDNSCRQTSILIIKGDES